VEHLEHERLVVHEQHSRSRLERDRIRGPAMSAQESLELVQIDAAVAAGGQVRAELARPDPSPQGRDGHAAVSRRLSGREVLTTASGQSFHFLHI